jgi:hypothetical protein
MTDQEDPVEAERPPEEEPAAGPPEDATSEQPEEQRQEPGSPPRPPSGWNDLDAYCEQLRAEHTEWSERIDTIDTQLLALRATLAGIGEQYRALSIEDDLALINERILGGAGMAQSLRIGHDLERYTALIWSAAGDPRPAMTRSEEDVEYRVEIWMHMGPDGKGRIRIEGEKRLEATLPTSRERVRSVLIRAVQSPKVVSRGESEAAESPAPPPPPERAEQEPVEAASPRPGDPEQQPPPEEQVIPLGPSEESEPEQETDEPGEA